ncbi:MAG: ACT domain-containing protein [Phycisphaerae bacterium]|nr:ACT domain-containing protein [Phycisphaerae bacterium]
MFNTVTVTQFSVFLVNKPGVLSRVCDELAAKKINIIALTLMDSIEHGVFRLVAKNAETARNVLKSLNVPMTETEVLTVEMPNRPGAMADLCAKLNSRHVSIRYAYLTSGATGGHTTGIFKVDNIKKAMKVASAKKTKRKEKKVTRVARGTRVR